MKMIINSGSVVMVKKSSAKFSSVILTLGVLTSLLSGPADLVAGQTSFVAGLTGNQEVPAVDSNATGSTSFVSKFPGTMSYVVNVTGITNVTGADLSIGKQGENGPVAVILFKAASPTTKINGTLSEGNISSANLEGPMKGKQVTDLADIMQQGGAYVNILTVQNPRGEIRGQIGFEGVDESGTIAGQGNITREPVEVD
jgi:hypothetical protein